jgi:hypothetical protein
MVELRYWNVHGRQQGEALRIAPAHIVAIEHDNSYPGATKDNPASAVHMVSGKVFVLEGTPNSIWGFINSTGHLQ